MSKCDIAIDFYRPDREFRTGQTVHGWVRVSVNKNLKCRALQLNVFWKTHGRGNTTRQNYFQQTLFQGEWQVGDTYEYPFEFSPPLAPLTYHGRYLNIDHYVSVRADIPWAADPRKEEEFMWRVGSKAPDPGTEQPVLESGSGCGRNIGLAVAAIMAIVAVALTAMGNSFWLLLLLIPAVLTAFLCLRSRLAESKLGEVKWGTLDSCFAGEEMPSLLQIGPVGNVTINEVTATIQGIESVVSGSGTDATTYTHALHKQHQVVATTPAAKRGEIIELQPSIIFPETDAYSVDLPDNKIKWSVTVAIRLRMWPDWAETREVLLVGRPTTEIDENPNPAFDTLSLHELIGVARQLSGCGNDKTLIEKNIAHSADKLFTVSADVDRVLPADTGFDDPAYADGRTVTGRLSGSDIQISLQLPSRYNQQVDSLGRGQPWSGKGAVIGWDPLQERLTILGI